MTREKLRRLMTLNFERGSRSMLRADISEYEALNKEFEGWDSEAERDEAQEAMRWLGEQVDEARRVANQLLYIIRSHGVKPFGTTMYPWLKED